VAIYTTFFVCNPEQLAAGFLGWQPPLPNPVKRSFNDPFTGETTTIETREPEWPQDEGIELMEREYQVVSIEGSYADYLEARLPPFVRAQPHWCAKNLTEVELRPLAEAAGVAAKFECPLYAPPSLGAGLQEISSELCRKLSALGPDGLTAIASQWAATMSAPEYTHSVSGVKLSEGWTDDEPLSVLKPVTALARQMTGGNRMYLLIET
jgi:hypothetical protein